MRSACSRRILPGVSSLLMPTPRCITAKFSPSAAAAADRRRSWTHRSRRSLWLPAPRWRRATSTTLRDAAWRSSIRGSAKDGFGKLSPLFPKSSPTVPRSALSVTRNRHIALAPLQDIGEPSVLGVGHFVAVRFLAAARVVDIGRVAAFNLFNDFESVLLD